jgi:hypothetical protein
MYQSPIYFNMQGRVIGRNDDLLYLDSGGSVALPLKGGGSALRVIQVHIDRSIRTFRVSVN